MRKNLTVGQFEELLSIIREDQKVTSDVWAISKNVTQAARYTSFEVGVDYFEYTNRMKNQIKMWIGELCLSDNLDLIPVFKQAVKNIESDESKVLNMNILDSKMVLDDAPLGWKLDDEILEDGYSYKEWKIKARSTRERLYA